MSPVLHLNRAVLRQDEMREGLEVLVPGLMGYVRMVVANGGERWYASAPDLLAGLQWFEREKMWTTVVFGRTDCISKVTLKDPLCGSVP